MVISSSRGTVTELIPECRTAADITSVFYQPEDSESLYALPYPYLIPSIKGMFQEMYYWDTYFTNVGLLVEKNAELAEKEYQLAHKMEKNYPNLGEAKSELEMLEYVKANFS